MVKNFQGTFFFDPDDRIYKDHFPSNPIVPGTLMVRSFMGVLENQGVDTGAARIENFRFRVFIAPGEYRYSVELVDGRAKCLLLNGKTKVATGIIVI